MNILAIKRRNESLVEHADDVMGHFVPAMLNLLQTCDSRPQVRWVLHDVMEQARALGEVLGNIRKHAEELLLPRNQSHAAEALLFGITCENVLLSHARAGASHNPTDYFYLCKVYAKS